ncbi:MAG: hypothetical protein AB7O24_21225 [Kofleriaceae bacterium]
MPKNQDHKLLRSAVCLATSAVASVAAIGAGCADPDEVTEIGSSTLTGELDVHRSLIITDQVILEPAFSFKAVMDQIVGTSGSNITAKQLFQQWWSTQNPGDSKTPRCDDETSNGVATFNGFPFACPRAEGAQASVDPFTPAIGNPNGYVPIALTNRFDLAPANGENCGEYRIIFAKNSGITTATNRNLVIFEAVLPNPNPGAGLAACRPIAQFWADLSSVADVNERRQRLQQFYFQGIPGFKPVIFADHFGGRITAKGHAIARGQIRSNQFMENPWLLREWRLMKDSRCGVVKMRMIPTTVKNNPGGVMYDAHASTDARSVEFRSRFIEEVANLSAAELSGIFYRVDNHFNAGQSVAQGTENNYGAQLELGQELGPSFANAISQKLVDTGHATLTPKNVADRATTQSCAGCHRLSDGADLGEGLSWPGSPLRFVHVTELGGPTEQGPDGPRWAISAGLRDSFLPHRADVLVGYLEATPVGGAPAGGTPQVLGLLDPILNLVIRTVAQTGDSELLDLAPLERVVFIGVPGLLQCLLQGIETTASDLVPIEQLDLLGLPTLGGSTVH